MFSHPRLPTSHDPLLRKSSFVWIMGGGRELIVLAIVIVSGIVIGIAVGVAIMIVITIVTTTTKGLNE